MSRGGFWYLCCIPVKGSQTHGHVGSAKVAVVRVKEKDLKHALDMTVLLSTRVPPRLLVYPQRSRKPPGSHHGKLLLPQHSVSFSTKMAALVQGCMPLAAGDTPPDRCEFVEAAKWSAHKGLFRGEAGANHSPLFGISCHL